MKCTLFGIVNGKFIALEVSADTGDRARYVCRRLEVTIAQLLAEATELSAPNQSLSELDIIRVLDFLDSCGVQGSEGTKNQEDRP